MANIKGTNGPDTLTGTPGNDHIEGKGGGDTITGGGGDDTINGGQGIDVANYSGNFADYTLTFKGHGHEGHGDGDGHGDDDGHGNNDLNLTVADHVAGRDGTDQLKNVEFLHFNDANFDVGLNVTHFGDKTIDSLAVQSANPTDPNFGPHPGTMWFGSGNAPTHYNIADLNEQNVELGLKIHYRTGDDITPTGVDFDGTAHYNAPHGTQVVDPAHGVFSANANRAAWNFDYVVDTGINHSASTLADFDFQTVITQTTPSNATHTETFFLDPATHIWANQAHTAGFSSGVSDDFNTPASAAVESKVAENSVNLGFLTSVFGPLATSTAAGTHYDIEIDAFSHDVHDHHQALIGSVHDVLTLV